MQRMNFAQIMLVIFKFYAKDIFVLCCLPLTAHFSCRSRNRDKYGDKLCSLLSTCNPWSWVSPNGNSTHHTSYCSRKSTCHCPGLNYNSETSQDWQTGGMQGVPARKLCPGRDRLPLCTPRRQHHDRHKWQHRNRLYGLHKGALHEGEMQIFSPSCTLAGQNQSCAAPSQPSRGSRPGSRGRGHSHGLSTWCSSPFTKETSTWKKQRCQHGL